MAKYKRTDFEDDEASSNGSVSADVPSLGRTHIRYRQGAQLWFSRSRLEQFLLVLVAALALVVLVLACVIGSRSPSSSTYDLHFTPFKNDTHPQSGTCLTQACVTVAAALLNAMDHHVDPCQDFYRYACGGWIKSNPIPEGKSIWGTFGKLWQENQLVMRNVLEKPLSSNASKAEIKAQVYYNSCMDANDTMEKLGAKPLTDLIYKVGGWNISGNTSIENWHFERMLQTLQNEYNIGGLFSWVVGEDERNSSRYIIQIDQGGLTLPTRDYYLNKSDSDEVLQAYLKFMTQVGVLLGGEENATREQMKDVIEFEKRLANITVPADERRDDEKLYHNMTIQDLEEIVPAIDWVQYFNIAFRQVKREIKLSERIVVYAPEYLRNLNDILIEHKSHPEGRIILNNYLVWHLARAMTSYLSKAFRDASKILRKALVGSAGGEEPWRYCVTDTNNVIGFALGAMFVCEAFKGGSKGLAENMISEIREAFKDNLPQLKWMDEETRRLAREKADAITNMIGFPDYIMNSAQLDDYYKRLEFKDNDYFANNIRVNKFSLIQNLERLDQPVNKTRWGMTPPTVNAYYTPTKNQIVFPAGILQAPFYDTSYPRSLNFGGMGVVMGHELTHAFDDQGREYDRRGNLRPWWNNATVERFKNQTQCMVDQYSDYGVGADKLNGKQTLGENIADNGGLKAAYHAYKGWVQVHGVEPPLPGVNLTHSQLFFLGFAQVWCSASTKEALHLQLLNDPHSPAEYRVKGPLSNSKEFSRQFRCPLGSAMNRQTKCEVW